MRADSSMSQYLLGLLDLYDQSSRPAKRPRQAWSGKSDVSPTLHDTPRAAPFEPGRRLSMHCQAQWQLLVQSGHRPANRKKAPRYGGALIQFAA
jgi:hypothetical protein